MRIKMKIDKLEIERHFAIGDVVVSGGGKAKFKIVKITDKNIRIQPTAARTAFRLAYERLSIIVENFDRVDKTRIEKSVGQVLEENGTRDSQNESYIYGFAREYLSRSTRTLAGIEGSGLNEQGGSGGHSNSYCEAWLGGWQRILVSEARLHCKPLVRCIECHGAVVLMKAGPRGIPRAHAEHRPGHEGCSLGHYYQGVSFPHPNPVQDPVNGSRDSFADLVINEDEESTFPEGAESYKLHKKRERDPKIVLQAKAKRLRETQKLECEVCSTDFHLVYGKLGLGFIEAHHKVPVAQLDGKTPTTVDDLAMVCSNYHRMLHRSGGRTVDELREIIQRAV
jgi:hypothetical protein